MIIKQKKRNDIIQIQNAEKNILMTKIFILCKRLKIIVWTKLIIHQLPIV